MYDKDLIQRVCDLTCSNTDGDLRKGARIKTKRTEYQVGSGCIITVTRDTPLVESTGHQAATHEISGQQKLSLC